jgi:hypothetical protein
MMISYDMIPFMRNGDMRDPDNRVNLAHNPHRARSITRRLEYNRARLYSRDRSRRT